MASRHDTSSPCVAADSLGLGENVLGLWEKCLFSLTRKAKQIWQQSGLVTLDSAVPWSGTHSQQPLLSD